MATKWIDAIECKWCGRPARVGIEKDGRGNTYRVICNSCGVVVQVGRHYPARERITQLLEEKADSLADYLQR